MRRSLLAAALLVPTMMSAAHADVGDVYLYNLRSNPDQFMFITLANPLERVFISQKVNYGTFAMDFDPTASILYAHNVTTLELGTISLVDGAFTAIGLITGVTAGQNVTGLTIAPNGAAYLTTGTELYTIDLTSGACTLIGTIAGATLVIDIAADNTGALYAHDIGTDTLLSVNPKTAVATTIGSHGLAANFAQGMDFDWSTNTLYAALYTGGGTGRFVSWDVTTGAITTIVDTGAAGWNSEFEMSVRSPAPDDGCAGDFNDDGTVTSQDFFDFLSAFFVNAPEADVNGDKVVNSQDFFDFLTAFFAGC